MHVRVSGSQLSGFTLIELVIVLVLIAILTAVIVPEMSGTFEGEVLRATGRTLASGIGIAYSQSVSRNEQHRLVIDNEEHRYRIEGFMRSEDRGRGFMQISVPGAEGELDERIQVEIREPETEQENDRIREVAPAIERQTGRNEPEYDSITFYPDGRAQNAEIWLRDSTGFGLKLKINPTTSRVSITELEKEPVR